MLLFAFPFLSAALRFAGDCELIRRLQTREPQAIVDLYDRYGRSAYSVIYRVVRNAAVTEDLLQETFLHVWNCIGAVDAEQDATLEPWILTVARNRAVDHLRSADGRMARDVPGASVSETPGLFTSPPGEAGTKGEHPLRQAVEKLNSNERVVLELAYYEGLTQNEIAGRMRQPLETIQSWVHSALKILRDRPGEAGTE